MGGEKVNINYYRNENWVDNTFSKRGKKVLALLAMVFSVGIVAGGCGMLQNFGIGGGDTAVPEAVAPVVPATPEPQATEEVVVEEQKAEAENVEMDVEENQATSMIAYDVTSIGRSDPFMPSDEIRAFDEARRSAYAEAEAHNSRIAEIEKLRDVVVREPDDISPYSFNLPTPPTALADASSDAAKITRTKVVGIMYNKTSPSAIINVDEKDYLVRQGDQIIGQEYKVLQINPSWITVGLGTNIYSASIGELFSRDQLDNAQNDVYNLRSRFGGRKG